MPWVALQPRPWGLGQRQPCSVRRALPPPKLAKGHCRPAAEMSVVPQREIKARSGTPVGAVRTGAGIAEPVPGERLTVRGFLAVFKHSRRAIELVWSTNSVLSVALALLTLIAGVLPAAIA